MADMKKCSVCGKEYNYCPNCEKTHSWKFYTCEPEHYQIHMALNSYRGNVFTKKDVIEYFETIGITPDKDLSYLLPEVERDIRLIIGDKPVKKNKKSVEETTEE